MTVARKLQYDWIRYEEEECECVFKINDRVDFNITIYKKVNNSFIVFFNIETEVDHEKNSFLSKAIFTSILPPLISWYTDLKPTTLDVSKLPDTVNTQALIRTFCYLTKGNLKLDSIIW